MNDLSKLSDAELAQKIAEAKERKKRLNTPQGRKVIVTKMLTILNIFKNCGYVLPEDKEATAELWVGMLEDEIARISFEGIEQAVTNYIQEDTRRYLSLPGVAEIKDRCHEIDLDPVIAKARQLQLWREQKLEDEHREHVKKYAKENPKRWEEICRMADELAEGKRTWKQICSGVID